MSRRFDVRDPFVSLKTVSEPQSKQRIGSIACEVASCFRDIPRSYVTAMAMTMKTMQIARAKGCVGHITEPREFAAERPVGGGLGGYKLITETRQALAES